MVNDDLVWSSELKGFLGHLDFEPAIDRQSVKDFFSVGYLLENRTWFEGIELVPPASVISFDLRKSHVQNKEYWCWGNIKSIEGPVDEVELVSELSRLFKQSVRKRVKSNEKIGVTLSGGLDSRAILAAVPEYYQSLHLVTFGKEGSDDVEIARKVAKIKGAEHHIFEIDSNTWLVPRISPVWKCEGAFSLLHMHGLEVFDEYRSYADFNLNGFLGDAVLGGSYITEYQSVEYMVKNRGRRFVNQALVVGESWLTQRRPFFDKNLLDVILAIPKHLRRDSYIYNKMLLLAFPQYYTDIPWQKTGCPISCSEQLVKLTGLKNRVVNKLKRKSQRFEFRFKNPREFADYPSWMRQEPAKSVFENFLLSKTALYPDYIDRSEIHTCLRDHMAGKGNYHNELCLALTFELWLQQVFEGSYRGESTLVQT